MKPETRLCAIADASAWVAGNMSLIVQEWLNMGNPEKR